MEYKPNSRKSKEAPPEKKIEKIVDGTVQVKKKSEVRKLADAFLLRDLASVKDYIFKDVLLPAVKAAVNDIISNGTHMLLYGDTAKKNGGVSASRFSYSSLYSGGAKASQDPSMRVAQSGYAYDDILFESRGDAEEVLERMNEIIAVYGVVSVADLYDLAGVTGGYTDNKYGWTDISKASPARTREGWYIIRFPRATPID